MAIYHLTTKVFSRGKGQSAIAAAAYRSGDRLYDETAGLQKFYTARPERIEFTGMFVPANAPDWAHDRNAFWNCAERAENRSDARLAREIELALPHELTDEQRLRLLKDFVREQFMRKGYVADVAIHAPDKRDERNYHAHILISERRLGPDGFAAKKDPAMNSKQQLYDWRVQWANLANRHLERYGHKERIDHRTLFEQGIDREPGIHLGYAAIEIATRGGQSDRVSEFASIYDRNETRASIKGEITALDKELRGLEKEQAAAQNAEDLHRKEIAAQEAAKAAELARQQTAQREAVKAAQEKTPKAPRPPAPAVREAAKAAKEPEKSPAKSLDKKMLRAAQTAEQVAKAPDTRQAAQSALERLARADEAASKAPVAKAFAEGAKQQAQEIKQQTRHEAREASFWKAQEDWRAKNADPQAKPVQPPPQRAVEAGKEVAVRGLKVAEKATGKVMGLVDFVTDFLSGPSAPPPQVEQNNPRASAAAFINDPAGRRQRQMEQLAAEQRAKLQQRIWETIREDMQAGRNLKAEDIKSLPRQALEQIRHFGDDAVRQAVQETEKRAERYWKGDERERER